MQKFFGTLVTFALLVGVSGCTKLHPVEGSLVWDDGEPAKELDGGMVYFISSEHRTTSRSSVRDGGHFELTTNKPEARGTDGVPPGTHQVYVIGGGDPSAPLDRKYCDPATSGLEVTVPPQSPVVLTLTRGKKKSNAKAATPNAAATGIDN